MPGTYRGKMLRVNLTTGETSTENACGGDEAALRRYIGGTGIGARYLYDEVPPGVEWDSPENRLIFISGPLGGSRAPGSGTFTIVSKGPLTNLAAATQANGFFGAYVRFSGFDGIIFQGKAPSWCYLYVHDGEVELRDASHLVGRDCWETEAIIRTELKLRKATASVFGIGPAGENLVKFAGVMGDGGHMAGTNGTGAVMGSKRLKAVVVTRGAGRVEIFNARRVSELGREMFEDSRDNQMGGLLYLGGTAAITPSLHQAGSLPVKNYTTTNFPNYAEFDGVRMREVFETKPSPCWACTMAHCQRVKVTRGPYAGFEGEEPEYEGMAAFGPLLGITDPGAAIMLNDLNDRLGMDLKESGFVLSMTIEAFEEGLITKEQAGGLELTWDNPEAMRQLLDRIARRDGWLGDILAEGVMRAATRIGGEAPNMAIYTKRGIAPHTHQLQNRLIFNFTHAISNSGSIEGTAASPQIAKELGISPFRNPYTTDVDEVSAAMAQTYGLRIFADFLSQCNFGSGLSLKRQVAALNAATGWDMSLQEAFEVCRRVINLLRAFNIRHGLVPEDEQASPRVMQPAVDGPLAGKAGISSKEWDRMLRGYYSGMRWDQATGKPLIETLVSLGLEREAQDIWK